MVRVVLAVALLVVGVALVLLVDDARHVAPPDPRLAGSAPIDRPSSDPTLASFLPAALPGPGVEAPAPAATPSIRVPSGRPTRQDASTPRTTVPDGAVLGDVVVPKGTVLVLPRDGRVVIKGDVRIDGTVEAETTDIVFDGATQGIKGRLSARRVTLRGGLKRVAGRLETRIASIFDDQMRPELLVESDATLLIEEGAYVDVHNAHGYRIEGHLELDGGSFRVRDANGNGQSAVRAWPAGSHLTLHRGHFLGNGDHDFGRATIVVKDGWLDIRNDIWGLGASLSMYGGKISNTNAGGQFQVTGHVEMYAGEWRVQQKLDRGLRFAAGSAARFQGGTITIGGWHLARGRGGVHLSAPIHVPHVRLLRSTHVGASSLPGAELSIDRLDRAEGATLTANGFPLHIGVEETLEASK